MTTKKIAYYRLLNVGEVIPEGAEFHGNDPDTGFYTWIQTTFVGSVVTEESDPYRVPVYEDELAPKETKVIVSLDDETKKLLKDIAQDVNAQLRGLNDYLKGVKGYAFRLVEVFEKR
jgi:hypothetical protein